MKLYRIISFATLLWAAPLIALAAKPYDMEALQIYNQGVEASASGNMASATRLYERALRLDPNLADANYNLGVCYYDTHQYDKAARAFRQVLVQYPNDAQTKQNLSRTMTHLPSASSVSPGRWGYHPPATTAIYGNTPPRSISLQPDDRLLRSSTVAGTTAGFVKPPFRLRSEETTVYSASKPVAASAASGRWKPAGGTTAAKPSKWSSRGKIKTVATGFMGPTGMVLGPDNQLFVANYLRNEIYQVSPTTGDKHLLTNTGLNGPIGMVWNPQREELYVANYRGNTISRVLAGGQVSILASGLHKPYMLLLDADQQLLYVTEQETNIVSKIRL